MPIRLHLLRHGETESSISGQYVGSGSDIALTANGMKMAEKFAEKYKSHDWKAIYCSPLLRARQTIAPLQAEVTYPVLFRDGLKEINYGEWELKSGSEIKETHPNEWKKFDEEGDKFSPPGGETATDVLNRANQVLEEAKRDYQDGDILFVSHKTTVRVLLCSLLGIQLRNYRRAFDYQVCSLSIIDLKPAGAQLIVYGDQSHLA